MKSEFKNILQNYLFKKEESFSQNVFADFIRNECRDAVRRIVTDKDRYLIYSSPGQGNWADVPWVGIFDVTITRSAQNGFYLVYLFRSDMKGFYLSLNQGVTSVKEKYGSKVKDALIRNASNYYGMLNIPKMELIEGYINLNAKTSLARLYESGAIVSKYYDGNDVESGLLEDDLILFIDLYRDLVRKNTIETSKEYKEEDEIGLEIEDLTNLREHKRIERNQALVKKVKEQQGYSCSACGFNFFDAYGEIGKDFIEAHHLTPVSLLKGTKVSLDPVKDFAVLCSNCHKMIHKSEFIDQVKEFAVRYVTRIYFENLKK